MKININYSYHQTFLPTRRHRRTKIRRVADTMPVNIAELSQEDFPVAFIVHDMKSVQDGMASYKDYDSGECDFRMFTEEIRTYKGKLFAPIRVTHGAAISSVFENENHIIYNLERLNIESWFIGDEKTFTENSVIIEDDKEEIQKIIRRAAREYEFYDGKFWKVCGEPIYEVETFGLGANHGSTGLFIRYGGSSDSLIMKCFNALQREDAIAYGKFVAKNRGDTESIDRIGPYDIIEVVMPEMVKFNIKRQRKA